MDDPPTNHTNPREHPTTDTLSGKDTLPDMPFVLFLSQDPFDKLLPVDIPVKGDHPTLGLKVKICPCRNRIRLIDMVVSTPASRTPRWCSTLRNAYVIIIQGTPVYTEEQMIQQITQAKVKAS
jgi:hypothetical protein